MTKVPDGPWYYEQIDLGFNYRMTDIQAALGLSQLSRLDQYVQKRREIAEIYNERLSSLSISLPMQNPKTESAFHLYVIRIVNESSDKNRRATYDQLVNAGITANLHYIPVYFHPYYVQKGFHKGYCLNAESYYETALSIPLFPGLGARDLDLIVTTLKESV
jgi:dTDP-4-amino-4,6-dideoxygalactose transaminase